MIHNPPPYKVIFDTDPGVDDAIALYFALAHPQIDLVGITTTFGNVSVEQAAANALARNRLARVVDTKSSVSAAQIADSGTKRANASRTIDPIPKGDPSVRR